MLGFCFHVSTIFDEFMQLNKQITILASLFSIVGFMLYPLILDNYRVWFGGSQYEDSFESFFRFFQWFGPIPITAFLIGLFYPENETKKRVIMVGTIMIFLFCLMGLFSGSLFTMELRTEEYILHFLFVQTFAIFYVFGLGMIIRSLVLFKKLNDKSRMATAGIAFIIGWLVSKVASVYIFPIFYSWLIITMIAGIIAIILYRRFKNSIVKS